MPYDPAKWQMQADRSQFHLSLMALTLIFSVIFPYLILLGRAFLGGEGFPLFVMILANFLFVFAGLEIWKSPFHLPIHTGGRKSAEIKTSPGATDEAEAAIYARAIVSARGILLAIIVLLFCFIGIIASTGYPLPNRWFDWFFAGLCIPYSIALLPTLIAEWTTPMPPSDEEWEEGK